MYARRSSPHPMFVWFIAALLLLSACRLVAPAASPQPTQPPTLAAAPAASPQPTSTPLQPTAAPEVQVTQTPAGPTLPSGGAPADFTLDYSSVAQGMTVETVAALPAGVGEPYFEAAPQYQRLTLKGYPVANHLLKPQIFIYPTADLAPYNEHAGEIAADLGALLQTQQAGDHLPYLPLYNAAQVMHTQVGYLDFKSGKGLRYLTQFDQAPLPVNNYELIYTFQGLTNDGKYYIAAVLPVTNPELPAGSEVSQQQAEALNDLPGYLSSTVALLSQQPANTFTPDLDTLDALVRSIEVK